VRSDNPLITEITVPSNAGPGQPRIVIAGNTITGYYADDIIAWQCTVDPTATILSNTDAFPILTALLRNGTFVSQYPNAIAHNFSTAVWQNTDSTGVFTVGNNDVTGNHGEAISHALSVHLPHGIRHLKQSKPLPLVAVGLMLLAPCVMPHLYSTGITHLTSLRYVVHCLLAMLVF
jgi:hypothetical protein